MAFVARVSQPRTGLALEVMSNQPGVQFYNGNFLPAEGVEPLKGKEGAE
jgi:galactose mutarotase-like enzyme